MSETKFTPGPWTQRKYTGFIYVAGADGTAITELTLSLGGDERHNEEFRANAALIAASPELLEALRLLVSPARVEATNHISGRITISVTGVALRKADAAIRKATSVGRGNAANTPPGNPKT